MYFLNYQHRILTIKHKDLIEKYGFNAECLMVYLDQYLTTHFQIKKKLCLLGLCWIEQIKEKIRLGGTA